MAQLPKPFSGFGESINSYDAFLSSWQNLATEKAKRRALNDDYNEIEAFAVTALSRLVDSSDSASPYATSPLFDALHNSAIICKEDSLITSANKQALDNHQLTPGMLLSHQEIFSEDGDNLAEKIRALRVKSPRSRLSLLQCYFKSDPVFFPVAIIQLDEKESVTPAVLIIFLDAASNTEALELFSAKFGLTKAESDIVTAFSQGISLKEIAKSRFRSYTTIRNQFQSILEKTGCPNQADLLRMLLGVSYLLSFTEMITPKPEKTLGKKIQIMRPNGRFVDATLYGKLDGRPFIVLPSIFGMPMTEGIDEALRSQSLLMIGIWRPGFAETSKPHENDTLYQCLADDISAVLDSIAVKECPVVGRASSARAVINLVRIIPERVSAACVVNSLVPLPYITSNKILSRWTLALVSAIQNAPLLATLILETGRRLMVREGVERFMVKMYKGSGSDLSTIAKDGVTSSLHEGVNATTQQGFEAPVQDMIDGFTDWSEDVKQLPMKVTLMQGRDDPNVSIKASRDFAKDFPEQIELIEYENGGGLLNYSHSKDILAWVTKHLV